jgi:hypothetical protein
MATKTTAGGEDVAPFRFMDLPAELRLHVYEEVLVVGKIFYTPDSWDTSRGVRFAHWQDYATPSFSILRVSKQIHAEAEPVYLSKNLFVLPDNFHLRQPFLSHSREDPIISHPRRWLFSKAALSALKNVSISFNTRVGEIPLGATNCTWDQHEKDEGRAFESSTAGERSQLAHTHSYHWLTRNWSMMVDALLACNTQKPSFLEIAHISSYCITGCCRVLEHSAILMRETLTEQVSILGLRNDWEKSEFVDDLRRWYDYSEIVEQTDDGKCRVGLTVEEVLEVSKCHCDINPKEDIWAKWRVAKPTQE